MLIFTLVFVYVFVAVFVIVWAAFDYESAWPGETLRKDAARRFWLAPLWPLTASIIAVRFLAQLWKDAWT